PSCALFCPQSLLPLFSFFFFFSSRRRHTRFSRDWSSDVCSSDLSSADHKPRDGLPDRPKPLPAPGRSSPPTSLASAASSLYNAPLSSSTRPPPRLFKGL